MWLYLLKPVAIFILYLYLSLNQKRQIENSVYKVGL